MFSNLINRAQEGADTPITEGLPIDFNQLYTDAVAWIENLGEALISWGTLWQVLAIVACAVLGFVTSRYPKARLSAAAANPKTASILQRLYHSLAMIVWPVFTVIFLWIATAIFTSIDGLPNEGLRIAASLLNAWIVVRLVTSNIKDGFWQTLIALIAWTIAALYILRLLDPVMASLDSAAMEIGGVKITALRVITSLFIAVVALWFGQVAGDAAQSVSGLAFRRSSPTSSQASSSCLKSR